MSLSQVVLAGASEGECGSRGASDESEKCRVWLCGETGRDMEDAVLHGEMLEVRGTERPCEGEAVGAGSNGLSDDEGAWGEVGEVGEIVAEADCGCRLCETGLGGKEERWWASSGWGVLSGEEGRGVATAEL